MHNDTGPSIRYRDGWSLYHVHGVKVPADVVERPQDLTLERVRDEANAEVRRVMLSRYGEARYLRDLGAKAIHRDSTGELYRAEIADDEPIVMVKVRNSTPEPDGSVKDYWLRVPPQIQRARDAVAWTFGIKAREYAPEVET